MNFNRKYTLNTREYYRLEIVLLFDKVFRFERKQCGTYYVSSISFVIVTLIILELRTPRAV